MSIDEIEMTADVQSQMQTQFEVERFYYQEANLLDDRQFEDWVALFSDDTHYFMPIRRTRSKRELDKEFTQPGQMAFFDDTKMLLDARVKKILSGTAWAEDPPSRTRHLITNIEVEPGEVATELKVYSNFIVYRSRAESEEDFYVGGRQDVLRRVDGAWKTEACVDTRRLERVVRSR